MRQGQGNRNRNRNNRNNNNNRSRSSGGNSGNSSGGNSGNKVFDSNGPDVKVRGTAQTVAEKYMQLGRDAQSSGDTVAAETYYQHAEHYYRLWAANQPQGASLVMSLKYGEDEVDEDGNGEGESVETGEGESQPLETGAVAQSADNVNLTPVEGQPRDDGQQRNFNRPNNRERFRPRWQRDRDRNPQDGASETSGQVPNAEPNPPAPIAENVADNGQWEAPSFLQRPTPPVVADEGDAVEPPRRGRPRKERIEEPASKEDKKPNE